MNQLFQLFALFLFAAPSQIVAAKNYQEKWGYVKVREPANLFWWLYYSPGQERPLMLWLQGGPGASSAGFGNFQEIGPLNVNQKERKATWLQKADLLFIDQPVGSGFSYVTDDTAYTTDVDEIAEDLLSFFKQWIERHDRYKSRPFYIFCESYGGKMTAVFAKTLYQAIAANKLEMNFKGIALGDSWISPMDYLNSWGPYLYAFSMVSENGLNGTNSRAEKCGKLVEQGKWQRATTCFSMIDFYIKGVTDDVNFYNVLKQGSAEDRLITSYLSSNPIARLHASLLRAFEGDDLNALMNGPVRRKLGIIPANVTWADESDKVFSNQAGDFMKPVYDTGTFEPMQQLFGQRTIDEVEFTRKPMLVLVPSFPVLSQVDWLLSNTNLSINVYNGQLDLICDTLGTEMWVNRLRWRGLRKFREQTREPFHTHGTQTSGFYKEYQNFRFFWILRAGHMSMAPTRGNGNSSSSSQSAT